MKKLKTLIISQLILILSFFLLTSLTYFVYQNTYKETLLETRSSLTNELQQYIERSIAFGKNYNKNFFFENAINNTLSSVREHLDIQFIIFTDSAKNILHISNFTEENISSFGTADGLKNLHTENEHDMYEIKNSILISSKLAKSSLSAKDIENTDNKEFFGMYFIAYNANDFHAPIGEFLSIYLLKIIFSYIIAFISIALLVVYTDFSIDETKNKIYGKAKFYVVILLNLSLLSFFLLSGLFTLFTENALLRTEQSIHIESERMTRLLDLGFPLQEYTRAGDFYKKEFARNEHIRSFKILNHEDKDLLEVEIQENVDEFTNISQYLIGKNTDSYKIIYGTLEISITNKAIYDKLLSAIADILTVFIIALLVITEIILFAALPKAKKAISSPDEELIPVSYMRAAMAIFTFSTTLAMSFLPMKILDLLKGEKYYNLDPLVASSLPTSFEYFTCLFALLLVGKVSDRYGWNVSFILGVVIYGLASFLCAFAYTPTAIILMRSLAGFGYGFAWLSSQAFIFTKVSQEKRGMAFSLNVAGIYTGYIAGVSTGGILNAQLSAEMVFIFASFMCALALLFLYSFMRPYFAVGNKVITKNTIEEANKVTVLDYLKDKNILTSTFLILIPFSLIQIGLLSFGVPIMLTALDFSTSSIGRAIMIYGLVQVYLAPSITQYFSKIENKVHIIFLGVCIIFVSFILVNISYYMFFVSIFMLGIGGAIIGPAQSSYAINQEISEKYGIAKSVSIQRFTDKLGQSLGPLLFGILFTSYSFDYALTMLASVFLIFGIIFLVFARKNKG